MKYISALPLAASLAAAQMQVMNLAPQASSGPRVHMVTVGGMKAVSTGMAPVLGFFPESITANVGDTVEFVFMQKNHTVTQSTFAEPCKAMEGGQDSGFMPNPEGKPGVTWNMTVETADATWWYCKQSTHCGVGMVFSVNAATTGDKTMSVFKNKAINGNSTKQADLKLAPIQAVNPAAAAAPSTVTVQAANPAATGDPAGGTPSGGAAGSTASVVPGQGIDAAGQTCGCQCLCGINSFPQQAAVNNFGGFAGMIP